jgi:deoxyribodipyrimidine photo-lyase
MKTNFYHAKQYIDQNTAVCWLRRDLRLTDHAALYHALKENESVLLLFIFDTVILDQLEDKADQRVNFIHESLCQLNEALRNQESSILVVKGNPTEIFRSFHPKIVYANHDYESYAIKRDAEIKQILEQ